MGIAQFYVNYGLTSLPSAFNPHTKCSCKTTRKTSSEFYQGELTIIFFWVIFEDTASKLEKIGPIFPSFNSFPSLPSLVTDDRKQFQYHLIVLNHKLQINHKLFLGFSSWEDSF